LKGTKRAAVTPSAGRCLARQSRSPLLAAAEPHLAGVSQQVGDALFLTVRAGLRPYSVPGIETVYFIKCS
jgi:hypothetical protein